MMTAEGGVDIEELARTRPEALRQASTSIRCSACVPTTCASSSERSRRRHGRAPATCSGKMYELVVERDATLVEINPLVLLDDDRVVALDAKVTIDDNALWRHPDIAELADPVPHRRRRRLARRSKGLQYVKLDGEVGIIGNGAGLVMSTLDVVAQAGARAANFLDVGGGASADQMATSLEVGAVRSRREGRAREHLRRHHARATWSRRASSRRWSGSRPGSRSSCASTARTRRTGRRILTEAAHPRIVPVANMLEAAEEAADLAGAHRVSILVDERTRLVVQGITGNEGTFHTLRNRDYGTSVVAGVTPGQGRPGRRRDPRLRHGGARGGGDRRGHLDDLRARRASRRRRSSRQPMRGSDSSCASPRASPSATWRRSTATSRPRGPGWSGRTARA